MSALVRSWYPSPNYSSGGTKRLIVIHTTEGFTGSNGMYDCAIYFQGPVGASSNVIADNFHAGHICEGVKRDKGAWTQCNFNSVSVSIEQCAYAAWTRDTWLNDKSTLLRNTAQWIAEESKALGIPITRLSASQAQSGGKGICGHSDLGPSGCGHSDPGSGYPWDVVLDWARGGSSTPAPPTEEDEMQYILIPPKSVSSSTDVSLDSLDYKAIGFAADASTFPTPVKIRVAFLRSADNTTWDVRNVVLDATHEKVVMSFPQKSSGINFRREDDVNAYIQPNLSK